MIFKQQSLGHFATQHETITNTSTDRVGRLDVLLDVHPLSSHWTSFSSSKIVTTNDTHFTEFWWELSEMGMQKDLCSLNHPFYRIEIPEFLKFPNIFFLFGTYSKIPANKLLCKPRRLPAMLCGSEAELIIYVPFYPEAASPCKAVRCLLASLILICGCDPHTPELQQTLGSRCICSSGGCASHMESSSLSCHQPTSTCTSIPSFQGGMGLAWILGWVSWMERHSRDMWEMQCTSLSKWTSFLSVAFEGRVQSWRDYIR